MADFTCAARAHLENADRIVRDVSVASVERLAGVPLWSAESAASCIETGRTSPGLGTP